MTREELELEFDEVNDRLNNCRDLLNDLLQLTIDDEEKRNVPPEQWNIYEKTMHSKLLGYSTQKNYMY